MKSWTQDHKSTSQVPQPLSHNVSNNAGKIHVNVTFTIVFHIYFKIQGEVKWRLKEIYKDHSQTILETIQQLGLNWVQLSTRIKKPVIQNEIVRKVMMHVLHFTIIIFSHCWVLILVLHLLKKKRMVSTCHSQQWFYFI